MAGRSSQVERRSKVSTIDRDQGRRFDGEALLDIGSLERTPCAGGAAAPEPKQR